MQEMLTTLLRQMDHLEMVGVAETADDAIARFASLRPDGVILDLELRQGTGLDVLRTIKARRPECRVLIFTSHDTKPFRTRCLEAGADRFFSKARQHRELVEALLRFTA
jgi:DNA-binding NarL/FixJ family response regulator